jgi:hypothetical protein
MANRGETQAGILPLEFPNHAHPNDCRRPLGLECALLAAAFDQQ